MRFEFSVESHIAEIEGSPPGTWLKWVKRVKQPSTLATLATLATCPTAELTFFRDVGAQPFSDMTAPERIEARRQQLMDMME